MNILVTGGAGYIGSITCKALKAAGYNPITLDNLSGGNLVKWGDLVECDVNDHVGVAAALKKYQPIAVIHLAGSISVEESTKNPQKFMQENIGGTKTLLAAMRECGLGNLVFASSAAAENPANPYGESKLACEELIKQGGISAVALRYFNAAGADPQCEAGEMHEPETHIIPLAIEAAMLGTPFKLFGTNYQTPDGTAVRDYIHVADLANINVRALEFLLAGAPKFTLLNAGSGQGISVKQILQIVELEVGKKIEIITQPNRAGDAAELIASTVELQKTLGYTLRYSDINYIVKTAYNWYVSNQVMSSQKLGFVSFS